MGPGFLPGRDACSLRGSSVLAMSSARCPGQSTRGRFLGAASILAGVCLIGAGIARVLRSDYLPSMGLVGIFLAPAEIFLGTVLLFVPLYWRLSQSSEAADSDGE